MNGYPAQNTGNAHVNSVLDTRNVWITAQNTGTGWINFTQNTGSAHMNTA